MKKEYKQIKIINSQDEFEKYCNKTEYVGRNLYTNFFEYDKVKRDGHQDYVYDNPHDYLLKINCDLKLPKYSIFDAFCDVEAQNIEGGMLYINGDFKCQNIKVQSLFAYNLECDFLGIETEHTKACYWEYITERGENGCSCRHFGLFACHITDDFEFEHNWTDIIIGEHKPCDDRIFNIQDYEFDYLFLEKLYNDGFLEYGDYENEITVICPHTVFEGGEIKANKIHTQSNILCGLIEAENVKCDMVFTGNLMSGEIGNTDKCDYYENDGFSVSDCYPKLKPLYEEGKTKVKELECKSKWNSESNSKELILGNTIDDMPLTEVKYDEPKIEFTPRPNTTPKADMDKGLKK